MVAEALEATGRDVSLTLNMTLLIVAAEITTINAPKTNNPQPTTFLVLPFDLCLN
jgi:hypothetical protein